MKEGTRPLDITFCRRPVTAHLSPRHTGKIRAEPTMVTSLLVEAGHRVTIVDDGTLDVAGDGILWIQDNPNWFPIVCRELQARQSSDRPKVVVWHTEPLPHPKAAGLPIPWLPSREIAKIILRDSRATNVYSNYFALRRLSRYGLPDLLVVSAPGRCEFLAERGFSPEWVPLGFDTSDGHDLCLERDIGVLFLGALEIPRRKKAMKFLRGNGIKVLARGSWFDAAYWDENRSRLINPGEDLSERPALSR